MNAYMHYRPALLAILACALFAGCSDDAEKEHHHRAYIIYSPNGEPLNNGILGQKSCEDALSGWFRKADTNQDGHIDHSEFMADASAQFARMDIDHNGTLVPEELDRYRAPYRPEIIIETASQPKQQRHRHRDDTKKSNERPQTSFTPEQLLDPVMSADSNLDFKVTKDEFMAQAEKNFSTLDSNHDNFIDNQEVTVGCRKK